MVKVSTPKGEYLALRKSIAGQSAIEVLPEILPSVVTGLNFPKSMYWDSTRTRFIRPIRWLLALLGEEEQCEVIGFEVTKHQVRQLDLRTPQSKRTTHLCEELRELLERLRELLVEIDPQKRLARVKNELHILLEGTALSVIEDKDSTEWPAALLGSFEQRFLKLPREILVTVMRDHQKYFAVENEAGGIQSHFFAVDALI